MDSDLMKLDTINNSVRISESPLSGTPAESLELELKPKPRKKPQKRKAPAKTDVVVEEVIETAEGVDAKPRRQRRQRKAVEELTIEDEEFNKEDSDFEDKPQRKRRRKAKAASSEGAVKEGEEEQGKPKKRRSRKTPEEDKIFDIPPIENVLSTTFKGRLGYACLNTMLRKYSTPVFCSRTCRLATIAELGMEHVRSLGLQNIRDLHTLIKWNTQHGIFFMRMSSEMFPFASHPEHGYHLDFADEELKAAGKTARELGIRLTSHPGQFTQLGSPREVVVRNAVRDLEYHCEMMDRMGLDKDSVMIIHMGGAFGDKAATLERFRHNYTNLLSDSIKARLVLENDELCYNVDDLLPLCQSLHIPLVFDYHHDWIYPSSRPSFELIPEIIKLWHDKGIKPKQHYSEPRPGAVSVMEKRAHSDRVKKLPDGLPDDMDLMLECKDKEQAVFHLFRLYNLCEVDPKVLRPPAEVETLHTNGRKSNKRAKAKAAAIAETAAEAEVSIEKGGVKAEVVREAEEHGLPLSEISSLTEEVVSVNGELDCGSGDEAPEVEGEDEGLLGKEKSRVLKRTKKKGAKEAVEVTAIPKAAKKVRGRTARTAVA